MLRGFLFFTIISIFFSCNENSSESIYDSVDFKQEMRDFVIGISEYSKGMDTGFCIIPQNGIELVTQNGDDTGEPDSDYLAAIDGNGQEDLFYGYDTDDVATNQNDSEYLSSFLTLSKQAGNTILVTDYCSTPSKMDDSNQKNSSMGFISFAATQRELHTIPAYPETLHGENNQHITSLNQVQNFLYLINPENYTTKAAFIQAVTTTNYDLLIMDLFFTDGSTFSASEIEQLKAKANGGSRMVICYMSIGEAENYRYYWQTSWNSTPPAWMEAENPDWEGNFKVQYWETDWQQIIYGNDNSYLKKILDAGFNGAYLDIIDAFEYFEKSFNKLS